MQFWLLLIVYLAIITILIILAINSSKNADSKGIVISAVIGCIITFVLSVPLIIDVPSAIRGGETLYLDSFPKIYEIGNHHICAAVTDDITLYSLGKYNSDKYEQDAQYCIKYTKFFKIILDIEKNN